MNRPYASPRATPRSRVHHHSRRDGGFFLVLVLVVIAVATMAVYSFTDLMVAADDTAYLSGDLTQARYSVDSGMEMTRLILAQTPVDQATSGGIYNNPNLFRGIPVVSNEGVPLTQFSVIAPGLNETGTFGGLRFGLQNESARLNVNALLVLEENSAAIDALTLLSGGSSSEDGILGSTDGGTAIDSENIAVSLLMTLPGMDESIADAILDWIDEDTEPRPLGCEDEYYNALPAPYAAANGPLSTVEELLLVRGVTPQLLFGADTNRNGILDADEQQRFSASTDMAGSFGWSSYLTVHGSENGKTPEGEFRVNVNQEDLEVLYEELVTSLGDDTWASFIVAFRQYGTSTTSDSVTALTGGATSDDSSANTNNGNGGAQQRVLPWTVDALEQFDLTAGAGTEINQLLDLVDATVTLGEGDSAVTYLSPFSSIPEAAAEYLPFLMSQLATQDTDVLPGRINLNECPAELLYGIPLIDTETMAAIVEARGVPGGDTGTDRTHETWPLTEGIVTLDQMRALLPLVTAGGSVYRAQIVGFQAETGLAARGEVIIDASTPDPQVVSYRDLTHLGRGFDMSVLVGSF
ncbi:MAG: type II secretion system protein GspK [Planctomycetota bacterium]